MLADRKLHITPWSGASQFHWKPAGLRETALRVQYLNQGQCAIAAKLKRDDLFVKCAYWRLHVPAKWAELVKLLQIPAEMATDRTFGPHAA